MKRGEIKRRGRLKWGKLECWIWESVVFLSCARVNLLKLSPQMQKPLIKPLYLTCSGLKQPTQPGTLHVLPKSSCNKKKAFWVIPQRENGSRCAEGKKPVLLVIAAFDLDAKSWVFSKIKIFFFSFFLKDWDALGWVDYYFLFSHQWKW